VYHQGGIHSPIAKIQSKLVPNRPPSSNLTSRSSRGMRGDLREERGARCREQRGGMMQRGEGPDAERRCRDLRGERAESREDAERDGGSLQRGERGERREAGALCREERGARCREERGTMQRREGHDAESREGHDAARIEGHDAETFEERGGHEGREELLHAP
jgi:hypothetical protein